MLQTKAVFKSRLGVTEPTQIEAYMQEGEAMYMKYRHPDPYTRPTAFGGTKYMRNTKPPASVRTQNSAAHLVLCSAGRLTCCAIADLST